MKKVDLDVEEDVKNYRPDLSCYCDLEELQSLPWTSLGLLPFLEWFRIGWQTSTLSVAYFCGSFVLHIETKLHRNSCCLSYYRPMLPEPHMLPEGDSNSMCWTFLCYLLSFQMPPKGKKGNVMLSIFQLSNH